ncbi:MAG: CopG family transcriptional regulator [Fervidicoccus sp.]|nr:MAG: CopG family transcriptional regulator [Fervidicoccus sp.]
MGDEVVPVKRGDDLLKSEPAELCDKDNSQAKIIAEAVKKLFELEREERDIPVRIEGALRQLLAERES